ncbi:MAG TPA: hypothetical protein VLD19_12790 [Chitinophagaceae bacterium]|nr:hypothetical protein [Chitinophagaceae bacterium]
MRRFIVLPVLLGALLIYSFQCRRDDMDHPGNVLKGKLLFNGFCGQYTIQLLEGYIPPEKIVASWKFPYSDSVYPNVFAVANACTFGGNHLQQGDVFTFELDTPVPPQNCALCLAYFPTPPISNAVKDVQKLK